MTFLNCGVSSRNAWLGKWTHNQMTLRMGHTYTYTRRYVYRTVENVPLLLGC